MSYPQPTAGAAWAGALVLLLAACPAPPDAPPVEDRGPPPAEAPPPAEVALDATCTNEAVGFRVDHPAGWVVNEENGLPPCSAFDPEEVGMPEVGDIPLDIAIVIYRDEVAFERVTDYEADPGVGVRSQEEARVDGRTARVAELESTGEGMYEAGLVSYVYHVELEGAVLVAATHDVEGAAPSFRERREILDAMIGSLVFVDG